MSFAIDEPSSSAPSSYYALDWMKGNVWSSRNEISHQHKKVIASPSPLDKEQHGHHLHHHKVVMSEQKYINFDLYADPEPGSPEAVFYSYGIDYPFNRYQHSYFPAYPQQHQISRHLNGEIRVDMSQVDEYRKLHINKMIYRRIKVPVKSLGCLIGKDGITRQRIEQESGVENVTILASSCEVIVASKDQERINHAIRLVKEILDDWKSRKQRASSSSSSFASAIA